jgi:hypothetical protein
MQTGLTSSAVFDNILHNALDNLQINRTELFVHASNSVNAFKISAPEKQKGATSVLSYLRQYIIFLRAVRDLLLFHSFQLHRDNVGTYNHLHLKEPEILRIIMHYLIYDITGIALFCFSCPGLKDGLFFHIRVNCVI